MKYFTMINVEKIKDMDTGGKHTALNEPILCNFNGGLGFEIGGINPLQKFQTGKPNQFPTKIKFENVPELISTSEKIRIANENQLPF
jgi:hypothetical protein